MDDYVTKLIKSLIYAPYINDEKVMIQCFLSEMAQSFCDTPFSFP